MATEGPAQATHGQTTEIRIHRHATVMGSDGKLGTVHQIIMNRRTGELQALVLVAGHALHLELPASHVLRATGDTIYVNVSQADLRLHPELAVPYNPDRYVPVVDRTAARPLFQPGQSAAERPMVVSIERDAVGVAVPEAQASPETSTLPTVAEADTSTNSEPAVAAAKAAVVGDESAFADLQLRPKVEAAAPTSDSEAVAESPVSDAKSPAVASVVEVPVLTPGVTRTTAASGSTYISRDSNVSRRESKVYAEADDASSANEEEHVVMDGMQPPVNPVNPGIAASETDEIYENAQTIANALDESQQSFTRSAPPNGAQRSWGRESLPSSHSEDTGGRLTWVPAVALGTVIVGIAVWSTIRTIRRGRRKATRAARLARENVRDSVREAGRSAVGLAQTVRVSAQEMAANPRDTATDAFSNLADIPARYRWFRRGMRVGSQTARLRKK